MLSFGPNFMKYSSSILTSHVSFFTLGMGGFVLNDVVTYLSRRYILASVNESLIIILITLQKCFAHAIMLDVAPLSLRYPKNAMMLLKQTSYDFSVFSFIKLYHLCSIWLFLLNILWRQAFRKCERPVVSEPFYAVKVHRQIDHNQVQASCHWMLEFWIPGQPESVTGPFQQVEFVSQQPHQCWPPWSCVPHLKHPTNMFDLVIEALL